MAHASWGSGWPHCQGDKVNRGFSVDTAQGRITFPGGIRKELTELLSRLVRETVNRGYRFGAKGNPSYGCWGFNCRAIGGTSKPSNHSWALAVDINAPTNPMRRPLTTDMPGWMPDLWNAYGFRWGGDYSTTPDAMHYEFMGSVKDAADFTQRARQNRLGEGGVSPGPGPQPPEPPAKKKDDKMYFLVQGDKTAEWWLTDLFHKFHVKSHEEAGIWVYTIRVHGGICVAKDGNYPEKWPQARVDGILRSDVNLVDDTWKVYAAQGQGTPAHQVIEQATSG